MRNQECRSRRRCFHLSVCYHIQYRLVALVSDACDDGDGEVGHVLCQCQCVKARHIACGPTASDDDHAVECQVFIDFLQGTDDALFRTLSLHDGWEESGTELKPVRIVGQLVAEVAIACGGF